MSGYSKKDKRMPILVRLQPTTAAEFEKWRKKLGQDKAGFAALCIQAGLKNVIRGVAPEESIDPATMASMIAAVAKAQGVSLKKALLGQGKR